VRPLTVFQKLRHEVDAGDRILRRNQLEQCCSTTLRCC
jgi:hypothetical protein